jgi:3-isopropylmalate/(R)-2-methylmalate dehydratase large subunit
MSSETVQPQTLYDKLWQEHIVESFEDGTDLVYIDRHLLHEVTSPQAFEGLKLSHRKPWRVNANIAVPDHNVPTLNRDKPIADAIAKLQVDTLDNNCQELGIKEFTMDDIRQGIVHVIGPEQGATLPGMTIVCGDSHTATHGALGALAQGIGTSEVEHVLATQCLRQKKMHNMLVHIDGKLGLGVTPKDVILYVIGKIGTAGGTGCAIEFSGEVFSSMSMEGRMTVCNMAIEAGARVGLIGVDQTTIDYVKGRPFAPTGKQWQMACDYWNSLHSDETAKFDKTVHFNASEITPMVSWGTSPEMVAGVNQSIPTIAETTDPVKLEGLQNALKYMDLEAGSKISSIPIDKVFIGSCTNSRIEDLRAAASVIKGGKVADSVKLAMVVPGSGLVKQQAEQEGLDKIFLEAGFEWREPGCSMCLAMNADKLEAGEHCASTSNRNFEGRQGQGGRTHLVGPEMAAAAAIHGHFVDVSKLANSSAAGVE